MHPLNTEVESPNWGGCHRRQVVVGLQPLTGYDFHYLLHNTLLSPFGRVAQQVWSPDTSVSVCILQKQ